MTLPTTSPLTLDADLGRFEGILSGLFGRAAQEPEPVVDASGDDEHHVSASPELLAVTHRIAGQFVEVIAVAAAQVLAGRGREALDPQQRNQLAVQVEAVQLVERSASLCEPLLLEQDFDAPRAGGGAALTSRAGTELRQPAFRLARAVECDQDATELQGR